MARSNIRAFSSVVVFLASAALAEDFKALDGTEFKNAVVKRVEPDGIVLATAVGVSKVYFNELPEQVRARYVYRVAPPGGSLGLEQDQRSATLPSKSAVEAHQPIQPTAQLHAEIPQHTYELTRDYVMGGDTGEVFARLKRGERYRGRVLANGSEIEVNGIACTVPTDLLSGPKDGMK